MCYFNYYKYNTNLPSVKPYPEKIKKFGKNISPIRNRAKDEISLLHAAFRRLVELLTAKRILVIVLLSAFLLVLSSALLRRVAKAGTIPDCGAKSQSQGRFIRFCQTCTFSPNQQRTSCILLNFVEPHVTSGVRRGSYRRLDSGVRRPYSIPAAASARQCDLSATFWTYPSSSDAPAFPDGIKKAEHPERNPSLLEFAVMATVRTNKLSIFILVHQVGLDFLYI